MPEIQALYLNATIEREDIVNLVASLVMVCPELERVVGFHIPYTHSFDRLSHALSTRPKLKERVWIMADPRVDEEDDDEDPTKVYYHAACDPTERFLELNSNEGHLSSLVLHQESARPTIDLTYRAIIGTIHQLPSLRHLSLSGLSGASFSNLALSALPPNLQSLRLENLPGVNEKGLQRLSSSDVVLSMKSLALLDLEIMDSATIAGFLCPHLSLLKKFSFAQHEAPSLCVGPETTVFQSRTLECIHWEIRSQVYPPPTLLSPFALDHQQSSLFPSDDEPEPCLATRLLATGIADGLFPALRRIRAPHDPQGVLQALCKPLATAFLRSDASFFATTSQSTHPPAPSISSASENSSTYSLKQFLSTEPDEMRTDSAVGSPSSAYFTDNVKEAPLITAPIPARSRFAAQARVLAARKDPYLVIRVINPDNIVQSEETIGGFLGDLKSRIRYDLKPDQEREAMDDEDESAHEWITGIDDVMGEWNIARGYSGCRHGVGGRVGRKAVDVMELF